MISHLNDFKTKVYEPSFLNFMKYEIYLYLYLFYLYLFVYKYVYFNKCNRYLINRIFGIVDDMYKLEIILCNKCT